MKTCEYCKTILPNDPYRETSIPATIYAKSRPALTYIKRQAQRLSKLPLTKIVKEWLLNTAFGIVGITALLLAVTLLIPGVYMLGSYALSHWMHWDDATIKSWGPIPWLLGAFIVGVPCLLPVVGRSIRS